LCLLELGEGLSEALVVDAKPGAELGSEHRLHGTTQHLENLLDETRGVGVGDSGDDREVGRGAIGSSGESELEWLGSRGGAMLTGEAQAIAMLCEVRVIVPKRVKVATPTQGLTTMCADALAHVMDDKDGDGMAALHLAEKAEEGRDVRAAVFVQTVQSHQGIEPQELRAQTRERGVEPLLIGLQIESDRVGCGDVEIECVEVELAVGAEGAETLAYAREGVFGEVDEARGTGRDADGCPASTTLSTRRLSIWKLVSTRRTASTSGRRS